MTVEVETTANSDDQVALLIDACTRAPWANVTRIAVLLKPRDQEPYFRFRIGHVADKAGVVHGDPTNDVRTIMHRVEADAKKRGKAHVYTFVVLGHETQNVRGKLKVLHDTEVEYFRHPMRMGEGEAAEDESGELGPMKVIAGMFSNMAKAYQDNAADRNAIVDLYRTELGHQSERLRDLGTAAAAGAQQQVEMARLMVEAKKDERNEQRQDRKEQQAEEAAERDAVAQRNYNLQMMSRLQAALEKMAALYMASKGVAPPPPPAGAPQGDGTIAGDLTALLSRINPGEQERLRHTIGDDLWKLLIAMAHAKDDLEAKSVGASMKDYAKRNPTIGAALFQAADVIAGERYDHLLSILRRAGVLGTAETK